MIVFNAEWSMKGRRNEDTKKLPLFVWEFFSLIMRELSMKKGVFIGAWQIKKPGIESRLISWEMMDNRRVLATFALEGNDSNVQYLYELE